MKHITKPRTDIMQAPAPKEPEILVSEISIGALLDKGLLALQREMQNLNLLSAKGKLSPAEARDLRDTVKLLFELKDREDQLLNNQSDEDLEKLAKDVISDK